MLEDAPAVPARVSRSGTPVRIVVHRTGAASRAALDIPQRACRTVRCREASFMRRSSTRIRVSHAGTVPRPDDLQRIYEADPDHRAEFMARLPSAVRQVVRRQAAVGIDVVNDGELSKLNFSHYARERLGGVAPPAAEFQPSARNIVGRDALEFPEFHRSGGGRIRRVQTLRPLNTGGN